MGLFLVLNSIGRRNETLSPTSIIEFNTKSEIPIRNKVTNFQKIEMMAAKKNKLFEIAFIFEKFTKDFPYKIEGDFF